ncbi:MAG: hypothetical protein K2P81_16880 [Bacteriovoracaceae bacterium]|nr:hypothetical protein [Bacteriovoracaceae bacterium]
MKKILFLTLLFTFKTWACKCDPAVLISLKDRPASAHNIIFAKAHVAQESQFVEVTHSFNPAERKIDLTNKTSCRVFLEDGERYLIMTSEKNNFRSCSTVFMKLAEASNLLGKIVNIQPSQLQAHPVWSTCLSSSDCELTKAACGESVAVNSAYRKKFEAYVKEIAPRLNCILVKEKMANIKPVCDKGLCLTQPD